MTKPNKPMPNAENKIILPKRPAFERLAKSHIIKHIKSIKPVIQTVSESVSNSAIDIKNNQRFNDEMVLYSPPFNFLN